MGSSIDRIQCRVGEAAGYLAHRLYIVILPLFLSLLSCSYMPQVVEIPDHEAEEVRSSFLDLLVSRQECRPCLDARMVVSLKSAWIKGSIDGYLKINSPDHLKYVALNPLGQTQAVLVADAETFHLLFLPGKKSYRGNVEAAGSAGDHPYGDYLPADFPFDDSFFLLTGSVFGEVPEIRRVSRAEEGSGYWLEIEADAGSREFILYDEAAGVIRQYLRLDAEGKEQLRVFYEAYRSVSGCLLPGGIVLSSPKKGADIKLRLTDWRHASCSEDEFSYDTPRSFKEVVFD